LAGPAALSLNPAIWEAIAATGWRGVNAIESTCGSRVEVAGIMRAMRLVEFNYELRAL
jgi:hypothetical protein